MAEKREDISENSKRQQEDCPTIAGDEDVTDSLLRSSKFGSLTFTHNVYNMNHRRRGKAIIFNHSCFLTQHAERKGTASDVNNLEKALLQLGFSPEDIHIYNNLSVAGISKVLNTVQKKDHTDSDMLMVFVLTHGNSNDKIFAYDFEYPIEKLWEPFRADACKSLAGKPKIFFVVACRGENIDKGQRLVVKENDSVTEVDATPIEYNYSYTIPVWADFLYIYSTCKGYYSYRDVTYGTWYIQSFCQELSKANMDEISFTDFLNAVNGRLSSSFGIDTPERRAKQISTFSSTLTKRLYFAKGTPV